MTAPRPFTCSRPWDPLPRLRVSTLPDEQDGRAKQVVYTRRGSRLVRDMDEIDALAQRFPEHAWT